MRFSLVTLLMVTIASAQTDVGKILAQGLQSAITGLAPVPAKDQSDVLAVTTELLVKHVTFRPDGTQSAICTASGRQLAEWKGLVVRSITGQSVTEADRLNGISKRYLVGLSCDAHRTWDKKKNAWGQWYAIGNVIFPSAITVEWKGGKWVAVESDMMKHFIPGPGPSISDPKSGPKSNGLPPGMTRGK